MDYLEWELERQREALRALLGGGSRDREAIQKDGPERGWTEAEAAGRTGQAAHAAVPGGREAASPAGGAADHPAKRSALRRDGTGRREGTDGGPSNSPVSAWEQALAGEEDAPDRPGGDGPEGEEAPSETPVKPWREGAGPQAAREQEPPEALERAGERRDGGDGGQAAGGTAAKSYITGYRLAKRPPAWAPETGEAGYRGGGLAGAPAEDGVRALSRAVQRDARRYDGGFTIY